MANHFISIFSTVAAIVLVSFSVITHAAELTGPIDKFTDGDTFVIWKQSIRLAGIDAPEFSQDCEDSAGKSFNCGAAALNYLKKIVSTHEVRCTGSQEDTYDRLLATCYVGDTNINEQLVIAGWAVAFLKYSDIFAQQEARAKADKKGMWKGSFVRPADYRQTRWDEVQTLSSNAEGGCVIKGNINSKGVKIYHTPWSSRHYNRTKISTSKGERWFCDEAEALAAGWRAPYR